MSEVRQTGGELPDIHVERFVLTELPAADMVRVRLAQEADAGLRERIRAIESKQEPALTWMTTGVRQRLQRSDHPERAAMGRVVRWSLPLAATAVLAVFVVNSLLRPAPTERIKGAEASLAIYRQTTIGSEQLADGAIARPGDVIRIGYRVSEAGFGAIVSVDGRGLVTVHHPGDGVTSAPLQGGDLVLLNQSYELDDAPQRERFYIVTSSTPFDVGAIVAIIRRETAGHDAATLPLPGNLEQSSFVLQKDSRP